DAVRPVEREDHLPDERPVGPRVEDAGAIPVALAQLAVIGEPEAAGRVEDDVVRAAERPAVAGGVDVLDLAGVEIDPLDPTARVVVRLVARDGETGEIVPLEAAVVADVDLAVGADRRAVRSAARPRDDARPAVRRDARERPAPDLDHEHAIVGQRDRALGELETARDLPHLGHPTPPPPLQPHSTATRGPPT